MTSSESNIKTTIESSTSIYFNHEIPKNIVKSSDTVFQTFVKGTEKFLELQYSRPSSSSGLCAAYHEFARVEARGRIVARIYNNGFADIPVPLDQALQDGIDAVSKGLEGPYLAHAKAQYLMNALGGRAVMAASALTQAAYKALQKPKMVVDYDAMANDPVYTQLQEIRAARRAFIARKVFS